MRPLDFETFVKFIFNEGNKMINVSEMKISLRKVHSVSISGEDVNEKKRKDYTRGYEIIRASL